MKNHKKKPIPLPEERERIVNAVVHKMMDKELLPKPPDELEILMGKTEEVVKKVRSLIQPIVQAEIESGHAHTQHGRHALKVTCHKFYVEHFRQFNREEALFLLALVHAEIMMGEFV